MHRVLRTYLVGNTPVAGPASLIPTFYEFRRTVSDYLVSPFAILFFLTPFFVYPPLILILILVDLKTHTPPITKATALSQKWAKRSPRPQLTLHKNAMR